LGKRAEVPIAEAVVDFVARDVELIAQAEVDSQLASELPIVLDEEAPVAGPVEDLGIEVVVRPVAPAQEEGREGASLVAVAAVEVGAGDLLAEAKVTCG
jgi:hypothetical protein